MKKKYALIGIIILTILLSLLLFFKITKPKKKEKLEKPKITVTPKEDIDLIAEKLIEKINNYHLDYYSKYPEITFTNESDEDTLLATYAYILENNGTFNKESVDRYHKEVFNIDINEHKDLKCYAGDGILYKFDTQKNEYIEDCGNIDELCHSHGGLVVNNPLFIKNKEITKEGNEYTISVNQIYGLNVVDSDGYFYSDNEYKNKISDLDIFLDNTKNDIGMPDTSKVNLEEVKKHYNDNYEKYKNNLPIYKYTFKKESDDFYLIKFKKQVIEWKRF